ncbi:hypothetical protein H9P43_006081 [Blastocladiella emersonii ATCC 22665]|nr:hypothetical protein H9P43_006081 [Blastocladiella emersonii ATCC 22665]
MDFQIPGDRVVGPYLDELRHQVATLLGVRHQRFPGAQPVSFVREHMDALLNRNFFVCEKTDGIRILMFSTFNRVTRKYETFLIDRKNDFYFTPILLPENSDPNVKRYTKFHYNTLIDGELILDDLPNGQRVLRFLVFDCLAWNGKVLISRPFHIRLGHFHDFVLKPLKRMATERPDLIRRIPFEIVAKKMELSYGVQQIFDEMPNLGHKSDGLIFTSSDEPYTLGTDQNILKWKPAEENTVDFMLLIDCASGEMTIHLWAGGDNHRYHGTIAEPDPEIRAQLMASHGKIIECNWNPDFPGNWRFMRFRTDKNTANHMSVYDRIMDSIRDGVSRDELVNAAPEIRSNWKIREQHRGTAPPPRSAPPPPPPHAHAQQRHDYGGRYDSPPPPPAPAAAAPESTGVWRPPGQSRPSNGHAEFPATTSSSHDYAPQSPRHNSHGHYAPQSPRRAPAAHPDDDFQVRSAVHPDDDFQVRPRSANSHSRSRRASDDDDFQVRAPPPPHSHSRREDNFEVHPRDTAPPPRRAAYDSEDEDDGFEVRRRGPPQPPRERERRDATTTDDDDEGEGYYGSGGNDAAVASPPRHEGGNEPAGTGTGTSSANRSVEELVPVTNDDFDLGLDSGDDHLGARYPLADADEVLVTGFPFSEDWGKLEDKPSDQPDLLLGTRGVQSCTRLPLPPHALDVDGNWVDRELPVFAELTLHLEPLFIINRGYYGQHVDKDVWNGNHSYYRLPPRSAPWTHTEIRTLKPTDFKADYSHDRYFEAPWKTANIKPLLLPTLLGDARFAADDPEPQELIESPAALLPLGSPSWRPRWATKAGDLFVLKFHDNAFQLPEILKRVDASIARYIRILLRPRLGSNYRYGGGGAQNVWSYEWQVCLRTADVNRDLRAKVPGALAALRKLLKLYPPAIALAADQVQADRMTSSCWERTWDPSAAAAAPAGFRGVLSDDQQCTLAWLYARESDPAARTFVDPDLRDACPFVRLGPGGVLYNFVRGEWAERDVWVTERGAPLALETRDSVLKAQWPFEVLPAVLALVHVCPGREPGDVTVGSTAYVESRATLIVCSDDNVDRVVSETTALLSATSRVLVLRDFEDYNCASWDDVCSADVVVLAEALAHSGQYRARVAELVGADWWQRPLLRMEREPVLGERVDEGLTLPFDFSKELDDYLADVVATGPAQFGPRVGEVVFERTWFHRVVLVGADEMTVSPKEPTELDIGYFDLDLPGDFFTSDAHAEARAEAGYSIANHDFAMLGEVHRELIIERQAQEDAKWCLRGIEAAKRLAALRDAYHDRVAEVRGILDLLGGLRGSFTVHIVGAQNRDQETVARNLPADAPQRAELLQLYNSSIARTVWPLSGRDHRQAFEFETRLVQLTPAEILLAHAATAATAPLTLREFIKGFQHHQLASDSDWHALASLDHGAVDPLATSCPTCAIQFDADFVTRYPGGGALVCDANGSKLKAVANYLFKSASASPRRLKAVVYTQFTGFARLLATWLDMIGINVTNGTAMPAGEAIEEFSQPFGGPVVPILRPESRTDCASLAAATHVVFAHPIVADSEHAARELEMRLVANATKAYRRAPVPCIKIVRFAAAGTVEAEVAKRRIRAPWES